MPEPGQPLAQTGRETERKRFDRTLRLRPNDAGTRYSYAMLLGKTQRYDDAQQELEACLRADPLPTPMNCWAIC
jgi:predicted Zn-dependent protease